MTADPSLSSRSPTRVLPLSPTDQPQAVGVLARAFDSDPIYRSLLPDPQARRRALEALWRALIATSRRYGVVDTTPETAGVACWLGPGHTDLGLWEWIRTGLAMPRAMMRFPPDSRKRFLEMVSATDRIRRLHAPQPHWYLWALGVDPLRQGQGIGRSLLAHGLARADAHARSCFLETETESNVAFYARRGFVVVADGQVAGARIWSMRREPGGSRARA
jgi:ribosomal protein S18 acetylase RimI-like enzyme